MPLRVTVLLTSLLLLPSWAAPGRAADRPVGPRPAPEWQWSAPVESVVSPETKDHPRAFLWIPPACSRVRAVVIGQHNIEEKTVFNNPDFRRVMGEIGFAIIWITPPLNVPFNFDEGAGEQFDGMLRVLAEKSGYGELALAPVVPLGHSMTASYPWNFAAWTPERTLAVISLSGRWPYYRDPTMADWRNRTVDGVPGLVVMGEREDGYKRAERCLQQRRAHPLTPMSMVVEPGGEHFNASAAKIVLIAEYLRKAAEHRLPADWPLDQAPKLKFIDPTKSGWLADRSRTEGKPTAAAAPLDRYKGDRANAFWFFDEATVRLVENFAYPKTGFAPQLVTFLQNGATTPWKEGLVHTRLDFRPEPDGVTFKLSAGHLDAAPFDSNGLKAGETVGRPADTSRLSITAVDGPVSQLSPDTFQIRFDRVGFNNPKRCAGFGFLVSHPGDSTFRPAQLSGLMGFPLTNKIGTPQTIAFNLPAQVRAGTPTLRLDATSDAGLPVRYYVREGPALIEDGMLRFTPVPPRAKFPVEVTVVAWQWGRSIDPQVQSATPVQRTLLLVK